MDVECSIKRQRICDDDDEFEAHVIQKTKSRTMSTLKLNIAARAVLHVSQANASRTQLTC